MRKKNVLQGLTRVHVFLVFNNAKDILYAGIFLVLVKFEVRKHGQTERKKHD